MGGAIEQLPSDDVYKSIILRVLEDRLVGILNYQCDFPFNTKQKSSRPRFFEWEHIL